MGLHAKSISATHVAACSSRWALAALALWLPGCLQRGDGAARESDPRRIVSVVRPTSSEQITLTLPGNVDPAQTTLIYARVNGYLAGWQADIGDRVKKGQELADIDTPELDQELEQARANLVQARVDLETAGTEVDEAEAMAKQAAAEVAKAKANLDYVRSVHHRNEQLFAQKAISSQELDASRRDYDTRGADVDAAEAQLKTRQATVTSRTAHIKSHEATVNSLEASMRRLEQMQAFKIIQAPWDGIVIRRRAEVGMLVIAGSATAAQELYAVAQADTLRIRIQVPQAQAMAIQPGQTAEVLVPEYPDRVFTAKVARTARAIEPASRTLMVELELPNPEYTLLPGTFGQVRLTVRNATPAWTVPANVLLSRQQGLEVAVVDADRSVHLRKIKVGRDYGGTVEVLAGLQGTETLVLNPPDDLADGEQVAVPEAKAETQPQPKKNP